ncbi:hypothetical protein [Kamptonema sp. UHCC 0994]|uniref:hypothetical protein n=1 Tax=Kamptonema sp. UHCC 0994 TaxID=3031329 RepID=UPI0023B9F370|nr:hypothetical protein [Kamptonema sp. UHCC 0994]MDF0553607.1 hypothetical protein [Kamptonema sp. UHCC 0994]
MKKLPWSSLTILFVTYGTFGWTLSKSDTNVMVWILAVVAVLLLSGILTAPLTNVKTLIFRWFRTDVGAFLSIITTAFFAVVVVAWLHLFATGLVLLSAGALARLDIQTYGFKKWQGFWILTVVSLAGLGFGGAAKFWF